MADSEQQSESKDKDPNYKAVYIGGTRPTLVEKNATKPPAEEDIFDDCGRLLFGE